MQGMEDFSYQRGYMDPVLYGRLIQQCADIGVSSIKLNYRGEPSLHPRIVSFVREAAALEFPDIMMNTNGNGLARNRPVREDRRGRITDLMFSVTRP
jgi:molybdenum cofactor biosynthesis enzyme MoaA